MPEEKIEVKIYSSRLMTATKGNLMINWYLGSIDRGIFCYEGLFSKNQYNKQFIPMKIAILAEYIKSKCTK